MNLAFPALFVLLLLLPGILLSYSYRRGFFRRSPITLGPIKDEIGRGIVLAVLVHLVALSLSWLCGGWVPRTDVFLAVFADVGDVTPETAAEEFMAGLWYLAAINGAALVVGLIGHGIVRYWELDLKRERLRFNNEWHYLFSGEARKFPREREADVDFVFVSVVVEQGEDSILYWGLLSYYFFDRTGTLDKIVLTDAQRRFLTPESDREPESSDNGETDSSDEGESNPSGDRETEDVNLPLSSDRYYSIRGEYFVIEYEGVQTLNVEYYEVHEEK